LQKVYEPVLNRRQLPMIISPQNNKLDLDCGLPPLLPWPELEVVSATSISVGSGPMKLKTKYSLPLYLESKLVNKYGWVVERREYNQHIIFIRSRSAKRKPNPTIKFGPALDEAQQKKLTERCDNIVNFFPDPYATTMAVRQRLHNLAQALESVQQQFVLDYMEENFPEQDEYKKVREK